MYKLACSWYKLTNAQRGILTTIYASGDKIKAAWSDMDTIMGEYWKETADELVRLNCLEMNIEQGIVMLKLKLKNEKRREYMRKHKRQSTPINANH